MVKPLVAAGESQAKSRIPTVRIEPPRGCLSLRLRDVWEYRELLYFLVWRDLKVRYKQTIIGVAWAVIQPLISMIIFSIIFGYLARIPSNDVPYPLFFYSALLPWNYFSTALNRSILSVVGDAHLISKVYFPRLILPLAGTVSGVFDFTIAFVLVFAMMAWYGVGTTWRVLTLPAFLLFALLTALAVGLWLSALNVRYRDIGHAVPFLIQIWMFCSPVVYPASMIPGKYQLLYSFNPMTGVIEGFRWALLGKTNPDFAVMAISGGVVLVGLVGGLVFFKNMERTFADVV